MKKLQDLTNEQLVTEMRNKNFDAILYGIKSPNQFLFDNAIVFGARYQVKEPEFLENLERLESTTAKFMGMPISSFVVAAMDILGVKPYTGDDETIRQLIQVKFNFD